MITNYTLFTEKLNSKFKFPENTEGFFITDGNLTNFKDWKVKILLGNNITEGKKVGDYEDFSYLAVSMVDNTIIPIAHSDEHHIGYDLLEEYYFENNLISNVSDYVIVNINSSHFIYDSKDNKKFYNVYKKLVGYGFKSNKLKIYGYDKNRDMLYIGFNDFMELKGDMFNSNKIKKIYSQKNKISINGIKLINSLEKLAVLFKKYHLDLQKDKILEFDIYEEAKNLYNNLDNLRYNKSLKKLIDNLLTSNYRKDIKNVEKTIFSFDGIKNTIHNLLRNNDSEIEEFFYNNNLALEEFNKISNI